MPQAAHDIGGFLERNDLDVHGEFDLLWFVMKGFIMEPGAGSKDTNLTIDLILMNIVMSKQRGEHILLLHPSAQADSRAANPRQGSCAL